MRKLLIATIFLALTSWVSAQESAGTAALARPGEGKCMVYVARQSSAAVLLKFKVYDGEVLLGKLGPKSYLAYECDPGDHVFYARSENTSYVEAKLEAGRTYAINAEPKMGIGIARVNLKPLDKSDGKYEKEKSKFLKFIANRKARPLQDTDEAETATEEETPNKHMAKFQEMKTAGKPITLLNPDMYVEE